MQTVIPELGQLALIIALGVALAQGVLPLIGAQRAFPAWIALARPAAWAGGLLLTFAFACLATSFALNDFSVLYVAQHSNTLLPMQYRLAATWGGHEGSLLLWALMLAWWTLAVAVCSRQLPDAMVARVLGVLGLVLAGFLLFILLTSNPFTRLLPAADEGRDLNPLLQDPGLIFHPPMLYMGYVGFSVAYAFAVAALLSGRLDAAWARWSRPWTTVAWVFLTLGIALGSWWAYYELGWGGWWFWDPVENASFMPWLVGTALIHSQAVTEKRGSFASWTLLLAIAAFSLSLLGTFLVRSGAITSVHAFAADPERGMFILAYLGVVVGGSLVLYAVRAPGITRETRPFTAFSRETLLLINNLLLTTAGAMVLVGTLYPMLADALELGKVSVGPPYFSLMFAILMTPVVMLLPFGPLVRWQREQAHQVIALLLPWAALALLAGTIAWWMAPQGSVKTGIGVAASLWIGLGTLVFVWQRLRKSGRMTREMTGMVLAHVGVSLFVIGALLNGALNEQREVALSPGQTLSLHGDDYRFDGVKQETGPNYTADIGTVTLIRDGRTLAVLTPEKRTYASGGQVMTEAAVDWGVLRDRYVALGESLGDGSWAVRVHSKPMMGFIWLAVVLIALGGFVTAADRRFRRYQEEKPA